MGENVVQTFMNKIDEMDYHCRIGREERIIPLYNVTFFVGAGFPKSIDNSFLSGNELFKFDYSDIRLVGEYDELSTFCRYCGLMNTSVDLNKFKSIYYRLQLMIRNPFLHGRFWDSCNLMQVDNQFRLLVKGKLDKNNLLKYVDGDDPFNQFVPEQIYHFFDDILHRVTEYHGAPAGIRNNFLTTNYDFMIESILDACSYDISNCGINTYRGFTPNLLNGSKSRIRTFENQDVIPLIKLNGGAEIYDNASGYVLDYRRDNLFSTQGIAPELILPCQEQSYSTKYFQTIFSKAVRILQETDILVIIGYSFPEEDGLVKFLLSQFAESECDAYTKHLFYITNEKDVETLKAKIKDTCPFIKDNLKIYSNGFENFATEYYEVDSRWRRPL